MCVCVRERERKRERILYLHQYLKKLDARKTKAINNLGPMKQCCSKRALLLRIRRKSPGRLNYTVGAITGNAIGETSGELVS